MRLILILGFIGLFGGALQAEQATLFTVEQVKLYMERYKWGDEFFLAIKGTAQPTLAYANLTLSLHYAGKLIKWQQLVLRPIKGKPQIPFALQWGPLNQPYEQVLAGQYTIKLALVLANQNPRERQKLKRLLPNQDKVMWQKLCEWSDQQAYQEEDKRLRSYYLGVLTQLDRFAQELQQQSRQALGVRRALRAGRPNPYIDQRTGKFDLDKWRLWFDGHFERGLQQNKLAFLKFKKKLFATRYPKVQGALEEYFAVLARLGRITSMGVHSVNRVRMDVRDTRRVDTFGIRKPYALKAYLDRLAAVVGQEFGVDIEQVLGHALGKH